MHKSPFFQPLSMGAQTAYAELFDAAQAGDLAPFAGLQGAFHTRTIKRREYVYFGWRDVDGKGRMAYVGPNTDRVQALVSNYTDARPAGRTKLMTEKAAAAAALGNTEMIPKHYRIVQKLAAYGFFKAGGVLVGTHAFAAYGNMLGAKWASGDKTLDVDFAHAGRNLSIALPASIEMSVHDALTSLEMGLLPVREFSGAKGAQYRHPEDPELRVDFLTARSGRTDADGVVNMPGLGLVLEPLRFMEYSLEQTTQCAVFSRAGACVVNLPDPSRYAIHKLIVFGERPISQRAKANKDLLQAAALFEWHLSEGANERLIDAWRDAVNRGPKWRLRAAQGLAALRSRYPEIPTDAFMQPSQPQPVRAVASTQEAETVRLRIANLQMARKNGGAGTTFLRIAMEAIAESGVHNVDWSDVEQECIQRSISEDGQPPSEVADIICAYSPGAVTESKQVAVRERIERHAPLLQAQYEMAQKLKGHDEV